MQDASGDSLAKLRQVVASLLGPGGCPWDQAQTPETLCDYVIEEAHELVEAIRSGDAAGAAEELGDVLFLLCFVAALYEGRGTFTMAQAIDSASAKMIRRHPHVFEGLSVENQEELLRNWERIKRGEKEDPGGIFASLPRGLPALLKAYRLNAKAARHHFTWESDQAQEAKLADEWKELQEARAQGDQARVEAEFGDYLFTLVEYGRRLGVKANAALEGANAAFLRRFEAMEALARQRDQDTSGFKLADWDSLWDEVKAAERG
ncbi:Nucleoside triphosphate pyrophosphohydrolase [Fundidesulfovibrio magnetotacticus]|uniref:Nucleoside triphosphate pyrophosphohydrolase n=1 Tax=Fundidesulfovibrio magnetotacticus TaxID=2730080 RepID=A0A6V8LZ01_9BACT|nr:nucleoside triphosphate pyrophosphohydrolase [Fundidesulfovibrio magnetotacticus]GFK95239.1 Nucleoside triphosphate pyrophosphohydrolase [Fundidesulfovibrio magnetotacticus]